MNKNEFYKLWKQEESIAHIHGWDFSHIEGKYMEEDDLDIPLRSLLQQKVSHQM